MQNQFFCLFANLRYSTLNTEKVCNSHSQNNQLILHCYLQYPLCKLMGNLVGKSFA